MAAPTCADELRKIYDAIMALSTGAKATTVSFGDRAVTYTAANLKPLTDLYRLFYRQCGAESGLADLSGAKAVERGTPATFRMI